MGMVLAFSPAAGAAVFPLSAAFFEDYDKAPWDLANRRHPVALELLCRSSFNKASRRGRPATFGFLTRQAATGTSPQRAGVEQEVPK
jgi:hypothetical protein